MLTHTLGFPRIGRRRELKKALEAYWKAEITEQELLEMASAVRLQHWALQRDCGIDLLPVGDFSLYDHVLDMAVMLGAIPPRFASPDNDIDLTTYFKMARGDDGIAAMEMSKWFDTNYHYIVPEFRRGQSFNLSPNILLNQVRQAREMGIDAKPVVLGPLTLLKCGKNRDEEGDPMDHLSAVFSIYEKLISELSELSNWIQIDEPALVLDLSDQERSHFQRVYDRLLYAAPKAKIMLTTYFGSLHQNTHLAFASGFDSVHVDLVHAPDQLKQVLPLVGADQILSLGIINGRNVWRANLDAALVLIEQAVNALGADRVMLGTSCSLLHVPVDLESESELDPEIRSWLAFAKQKCLELKLLSRVFEGYDVREELSDNRAAIASRQQSSRVFNRGVQDRVSAINDDMYQRTSDCNVRRGQQSKRLRLPRFPTTTIGSFPQTSDIRKVRSARKRGKINQEEYTNEIKRFIRHCVDCQHDLGLDVFVHGEPERNDMVEYFGEKLSGTCLTNFGWVQSYGSRCVKPPIIFGDVYRLEPMTINWIQYGQSLTEKPLKGMLTGPVTILNWSFVRDDIPRSETCKQIALAIRDEVADLEKAGCRIIQVDEAALREGMPLRQSEVDAYMSWAISCFKLAACCIGDETQLHTHMCYSEFNDVLAWIAKMDADVISIEASRSGMEILSALESHELRNEIGPGVYDIHSPRVPTTDEISGLLKKALRVIPAERLWVNPDCGLKTRNWPEVRDSLKNMVAATHEMREWIAKKG